MSKKQSITYYCVGLGKWVMRVWAKQCQEEVMWTGKCQGVEGHDGDHWCYSEDGSYHYSIPKSEVNDRWGIGAGFTPPGHTEWKSPLEMAEKHHRRFYKQSEVADPELIERLNRGDIHSNESLYRPVSELFNEE